MRFKLIAIVLSFLTFSPALFAQPQTSESLADVARKAREAREKGASAATTFNNDSITPAKPTAAVNPPATSQPAAPAPYELKTVPKYWPNCAAAAAELGLGEEKPTGRTDQDFHATVSGSNSKSNDLWTYSGVVTVKNALTVNLPEWANIPDDPDLRNTWQKMTDALRKHEEGHVNIAVEGAQPLIGRTVTGSGPSPGSAQQDAQRQLDQLIQTVNSTTRAKQEQYDTLTDHGRKQSAIGGSDVRFICR